MGTYVYKVTAKRVKLTDGTEANVATFAYKPYFWDDALNAKMAFKSGCGAAERFVGGKNYTGKIVLGSIDKTTGKVEVGSTVAKFCKVGTFEDYQFDKMKDAGTPVEKAN